MSIINFLINIGLLDKGNNTIIILAVVFILGSIVIAAIIKKFISTVIAIFTSIMMFGCMFAKASIINQFPISITESSVIVNNTEIAYKDIKDIKYDSSTGTIVIMEPDGTKDSIKISSELAEAVYDVINKRSLVKWS